MGSQAEAEKMLEAQLKVSQLMFGFAGSMALKCAVELRIADIINSHGGPITLSQIAAGIDSPSLNMDYLFRIMRFLVAKEMFEAHQSQDGRETLYGLNHNSMWLLRDTDFNLGPLLILVTRPSALEAWNRLSQCVKEGVSPFKQAHEHESLWDLNSQVPGMNQVFNEAMACMAKVDMRQLLLGYKDGFNHTGTLVDVGGNIGRNLNEIVKANPHLQGINFDLPHVVATAPSYDRITHAGGSMFESIPKADAIFMKRVLHDWGDEDCVKVLQNCHKALAEKNGKLIIAEVVIQSDENNTDLGLISDLVVLVATKGGKQRTELEWKTLLAEGGFPRYKIIKIPDVLSVIEAYPE